MHYVYDYSINDDTDSCCVTGWLHSIYRAAPCLLLVAPISDSTVNNSRCHRDPHNSSASPPISNTPSTFVPERISHKQLIQNCQLSFLAAGIRSLLRHNQVPECYWLILMDL